MPEAVFIIVAFFKVEMLGYQLAGRVLPDKAEFRVAFSSIEKCNERLPAARRDFNRNAIKPSSVTCQKLEIVK